MQSFQQFLIDIMPYGTGAIAFTATIFLWRWAKQNVELIYGPSSLPSGDVRMNIGISFRLPSNRHKSLPPSDPGTTTMEAKINLDKSAA